MEQQNFPTPPLYFWVILALLLAIIAMLALALVLFSQGIIEIISFDPKV